MNTKTVFYFSLLVLIAISKSSFSQSVKKIPAISSEPIIDGNLSDSIWKKAIAFKEFKTLIPISGLTPAQKTEVYLINNETDIFVGAKCFDNEPENIKTGEYLKDDERITKDDWIAFCIDSYNSELLAYFFMVNPAGCQLDGTLNMGGSPTLCFSTNWESAGKKNENGYTIEMKIPFAAFPLLKQSNSIVMGFKIARFISRSEEEFDFPEFDRENKAHLSQFQKISFSHIQIPREIEKPALVDINERYNYKKKQSFKYDISTLEGRCNAWGDASVIDYKIFPKRNFNIGDNVFNFKYALQNETVEQIFNSLDYMTGKRIQDFNRFLRYTLTSSFIVIHNDKIIYEKYFNGYGRDSICTSFSCAKSFASTLIGFAIQDGYIKSVDEPITKYIPELMSRDTNFNKITIRNLMTMKSGIRYIEDYPGDLPEDDDITYYHPDLRQAALNETEIVEKPDQNFLYNNYNPLLIGMLIERSTGRSVSKYLEEKIWKPLGMESIGSWSLDENGFEKMESGINAKSIDFAKFGRLFLNEGNWNGKQILSKEWIAEATQPDDESDSNAFYKYFWWINKRLNGKSDYYALGNKGQFIYICPQKKLIILRNGIEYGLPRAIEWTNLFYKFADKLE